MLACECQDGENNFIMNDLCLSFVSNRTGHKQKEEQHNTNSPWQSGLVSVASSSALLFWQWMLQVQQRSGRDRNRCCERRLGCAEAAAVAGTVVGGSSSEDGATMQECQD